MARGPRLLFGVFMPHSLSGYIAVIPGFDGEPFLLGSAVFEFVRLGRVIGGAGVSTEVVADDRWRGVASGEFGIDFDGLLKKRGRRAIILLVSGYESEMVGFERASSEAVVACARERRTS
jgi:hypothetical protein